MVLRKVTGVGVQVGIFLVLIVAINTIHFRFFPVNVVLYDTLKDVLIAGAISGVVYYVALRRRLDLSGTEAGTVAVHRPADRCLLCRQRADGN